MKAIILDHKKSVLLIPKAPYNFDANFHKPSHFPSSDNVWEEGKYWITMLWKGQELGLKFENKGDIDKPQVNLTIFSKRKLSNDFIDELVSEIEWRFNFESDISNFFIRYKNDKILAPILKKWKGMKPVAANSLYETLMIYIVLQNATVRRSVQMLENLFGKYGKKVQYDNKTLSVFGNLQ